MSKMKLQWQTKDDCQAFTGLLVAHFGVWLARLVDLLVGSIALFVCCFVCCLGGLFVGWYVLSLSSLFFCSLFEWLVSWFVCLFVDFLLFCFCCFLVVVFIQPPSQVALPLQKPGSVDTRCFFLLGVSRSLVFKDPLAALVWFQSSQLHYVTPCLRISLGDLGISAVTQSLGAVDVAGAKAFDPKDEEKALGFSHGLRFSKVCYTKGLRLRGFRTAVSKVSLRFWGVSLGVEECLKDGHVSSRKQESFLYVVDCSCMSNSYH